MSNDDLKKEDAEIKKQEPSEAFVEGAKKEEDIGLDDDLADALAGESVPVSENTDIDALIESEDPGFSVELSQISATDFEGVVISEDNVSDEVSDEQKTPSIYRTFIRNIPKEIKTRYYLAAGVCAVMIPIAILTYNGKLLPHFELPYILSMNELTDDIYNYDTNGPEIPLFDEYRNSGYTVSVPRTMINLKGDGDGQAYAQFEFKLNLRDEEFAEAINRRESEIIDLLQNVLAQITLKELQTPMGKEKVKKLIRHQINTYLQGNYVLGVYYHTVLLNN